MSLNVVIITGVVFNLVCLILIVYLIQMRRRSDQDRIKLLDGIQRGIDQIIYLEKRRELLIKKVKELGGDPYGEDVDPSKDEL